MNWEDPYFPVDRHAKPLMIESNYKNVPAFAQHACNLPGAPRNGQIPIAIRPHPPAYRPASTT